MDLVVLLLALALIEPHNVTLVPHHAVGDLGCITRTPVDAHRLVFSIAMVDLAIILVVLHIVHAKVLYLVVALVYLEAFKRICLDLHETCVSGDLVEAVGQVHYV